MRVLVVDDDPATLTMLRLELTREDCQVTTTADPAAAVQALEKTGFDWLVVDGQMEPINGFELAAKAKALQPKIKIVMISGVYELADVSGHPIGKLFQKPVDPDALVSYLRRP
jgi:DNA-binding response OmpR family regulator